MSDINTYHTHTHNLVDYKQTFDVNSSNDTTPVEGVVDSARVNLDSTLPHSRVSTQCEEFVDEPANISEGAPTRFIPETKEIHSDVSAPSVENLYNLLARCNSFKFDDDTFSNITNTEIRENLLDNYHYANDKFKRFLIKMQLLGGSLDEFDREVMTDYIECCEYISNFMTLQIHKEDLAIVEDDKSTDQNNELTPETKETQSDVSKYSTMELSELLIKCKSFKIDEEVFSHISDSDIKDELLDNHFYASDKFNRFLIKMELLGGSLDEFDRDVMINYIECCEQVMNLTTLEIHEPGVENINCKTNFGDHATISDNLSLEELFKETELKVSQHIDFSKFSNDETKKVLSENYYYAKEKLERFRMKTQLLGGFMDENDREIMENFLDSYVQIIENSEWKVDTENLYRPIDLDCFKNQYKTTLEDVLDDDIENISDEKIADIAYQARVEQYYNTEISKSDNWLNQFDKLYRNQDTPAHELPYNSDKFEDLPAVTIGKIENTLKFNKSTIVGKGNPILTSKKRAFKKARLSKNTKEVPVVASKTSAHLAIQFKGDCNVNGFGMQAVAMLQSIKNGTNTCHLTKEEYEYLSTKVRRLHELDIPDIDIDQLLREVKQYKIFDKKKINNGGYLIDFLCDFISKHSNSAVEFLYDCMNKDPSAASMLETLWVYKGKYYSYFNDDMIVCSHCNTINIGAKNDFHMGKHAVWDGARTPLDMFTNYCGLCFNDLDDVCIIIYYEEPDWLKKQRLLVDQVGAVLSNLGIKKSNDINDSSGTYEDNVNHDFALVQSYLSRERYFTIPISSRMSKEHVELLMTYHDSMNFSKSDLNFTKGNLTETDKLCMSYKLEAASLHLGNSISEFSPNMSGHLGLSKDFNSKDKDYNYNCLLNSDKLMLNPINYLQLPLNNGQCSVMITVPKNDRVVIAKFDESVIKPHDDVDVIVKVNSTQTIVVHKSWNDLCDSESVLNLNGKYFKCIVIEDGILHRNLFIKPISDDQVFEFLGNDNEIDKLTLCVPVKDNSTLLYWINTKYDEIKMDLNISLFSKMCKRNVLGKTSIDQLNEYGLSIAHSKYSLKDNVVHNKNLTAMEVRLHACLCYYIMVRQARRRTKTSILMKTVDPWEMIKTRIPLFLRDAIYTTIQSTVKETFEFSDNNDILNVVDNLNMCYIADKNGNKLGWDDVPIETFRISTKSISKVKLSSLNEDFKIAEATIKTCPHMHECKMNFNFTNDGCACCGKATDGSLCNCCSPTNPVDWRKVEEQFFTASFDEHMKEKDPEFVIADTERVAFDKETNETVTLEEFMPPLPVTTETTEKDEVTTRTNTTNIGDYAQTVSKLDTTKSADKRTVRKNHWFFTASKMHTNTYLTEFDNFVKLVDSKDIELPTCNHYGLSCIPLGYEIKQLKIEDFELTKIDEIKGDGVNCGIEALQSANGLKQTIEECRAYLKHQRPLSTIDILNLCQHFKVNIILIGSETTKIVRNTPDCEFSCVKFEGSQGVIGHWSCYLAIYKGKCADLNKDVELAKCWSETANGIDLCFDNRSTISNNAGYLHDPKSGYYARYNCDQEFVSQMLDAPSEEYRVDLDYSQNNKAHAVYLKSLFRSLMTWNSIKSSKEKVYSLFGRLKCIDYGEHKLKAGDWISTDKEGKYRSKLIKYNHKLCFFINDPDKLQERELMLYYSSSSVASLWAQLAQFKSLDHVYKVIERLRNSTYYTGPCGAGKTTIGIEKVKELSGNLYTQWTGLALTSGGKQRLLKKTNNKMLVMTIEECLKSKHTVKHCVIDEADTIAMHQFVNINFSHGDHNTILLGDQDQVPALNIPSSGTMQRITTITNFSKKIIKLTKSYRLNTEAIKFLYPSESNYSGSKDGGKIIIKNLKLSDLNSLFETMNKGNLLLVLYDSQKKILTKHLGFTNVHKVHEYQGNESEHATLILDDSNGFSSNSIRGNKQYLISGMSRGLKTNTVLYVNDVKPKNVDDMVQPVDRGSGLIDDVKDKVLIKLLQLATPNNTNMLLKQLSLNMLNNNSVIAISNFLSSLKSKPKVTPDIIKCFKETLPMSKYIAITSADNYTSLKWSWLNINIAEMKIDEDGNITILKDRFKAIKSFVKDNKNVWEIVCQFNNLTVDSISWGDYFRIRQNMEYYIINNHVKCPYTMIETKGAFKIQFRSKNKLMNATLHKKSQWSSLLQPEGSGDIKEFIQAVNLKRFNARGTVEFNSHIINKMRLVAYELGLENLARFVCTPIDWVIKFAQLLSDNLPNIGGLEEQLLIKWSTHAGKNTKVAQIVNARASKMQQSANKWRGPVCTIPLKYYNSLVPSMPYNKILKAPSDVPTLYYGHSDYLLQMHLVSECWKPKNHSNDTIIMLNRKDLLVSNNMDHMQQFDTNCLFNFEIESILLNSEMSRLTRIDAAENERSAFDASILAEKVDCTKGYLGYFNLVTDWKALLTMLNNSNITKLKGLIFDNRITDNDLGQIKSVRFKLGNDVTDGFAFKNDKRVYPHTEFCQQLIEQNYVSIGNSVWTAERTVIYDSLCHIELTKRQFQISYSPLVNELDSGLESINVPSINLNPTEALNTGNYVTSKTIICDNKLYRLFSLRLLVPNTGFDDLMAYVRTVLQTITYSNKGLEDNYHTKLSDALDLATYIYLEHNGFGERIKIMHDEWKAVDDLFNPHFDKSFCTSSHRMVEFAIGGLNKLLAGILKIDDVSNYIKDLLNIDNANNQSIFKSLKKMNISTSHRSRIVNLKYFKKQLTAGNESNTGGPNWHWTPPKDGEPPNEFSEENRKPSNGTQLKSSAIRHETKSTIKPIISEQRGKSTKESESTQAITNKTTSVETIGPLDVKEMSEMNMSFATRLAPVDINDNIKPLSLNSTQPKELVKIENPAKMSYAKMAVAKKPSKVETMHINNEPDKIIDVTSNEDIRNFTSKLQSGKKLNIMFYCAGSMGDCMNHLTLAKYASDQGHTCYLIGPASVLDGLDSGNVIVITGDWNVEYIIQLLDKAEANKFFQIEAALKIRKEIYTFLKTVPWPRLANLDMILTNHLAPCGSLLASIYDCPLVSLSPLPKNAVPQAQPLKFEFIIDAAFTMVKQALESNSSNPISEKLSFKNNRRHGICCTLVMLPNVTELLPTNITCKNPIGWVKPIGCEIVTKLKPIIVNFGSMSGDNLMAVIDSLLSQNSDVTDDISFMSSWPQIRQYVKSKYPHIQCIEGKLNLIESIQPNSVMFHHGGVGTFMTCITAKCAQVGIPFNKEMEIWAGSCNSLRQGVMVKPELIGKGQNTTRNLRDLALNNFQPIILPGTIENWQQFCSNVKDTLIFKRQKTLSKNTLIFAKREPIIIRNQSVKNVAIMKKDDDNLYPGVKKNAKPKPTQSKHTNKKNADLEREILENITTNTIRESLPIKPGKPIISKNDPQKWKATLTETITIKPETKPELLQVDKQGFTLIKPKHKTLDQKVSVVEVLKTMQTNPFNNLKQDQVNMGKVDEKSETAGEIKHQPLGTSNTQTKSNKETLSIEKQIDIFCPDELCESDDELNMYDVVFPNELKEAAVNNLKTKQYKTVYSSKNTGYCAPDLLIKLTELMNIAKINQKILKQLPKDWWTLSQLKTALACLHLNTIIVSETNDLIYTDLGFKHWVCVKIVLNDYNSKHIELLSAITHEIRINVNPSSYLANQHLVLVRYDSPIERGAAKIVTWHNFQSQTLTCQLRTKKGYKTIELTAMQNRATVTNLEPDDEFTLMFSNEIMIKNQFDLIQKKLSDNVAGNMFIDALLTSTNINWKFSNNKAISIKHCHDKKTLEKLLIANDQDKQISVTNSHVIIQINYLLNHFKMVNLTKILDTIKCLNEPMKYQPGKIVHFSYTELHRMTNSPDRHVGPIATVYSKHDMDIEYDSDEDTNYSNAEFNSFTRLYFRVMSYDDISQVNWKVKTSLIINPSIADMSLNKLFVRSCFNGFEVVDNDDIGAGAWNEPINLDPESDPNRWKDNSVYTNPPKVNNNYTTKEVAPWRQQGNAHDVKQQLTNATALMGEELTDLPELNSPTLVGTSTYNCVEPVFVDHMMQSDCSSHDKLTQITPVEIVDMWDRYDMTDELNVAGILNHDKTLIRKEGRIKVKELTKITHIPYPLYSRPVWTKRMNMEANAVTSRLLSVFKMRQIDLDLQTVIDNMTQVYLDPEKEELRLNYIDNPLVPTLSGMEKWFDEKTDPLDVFRELKNVLENGYECTPITNVNIHMKIESLLKADPIEDWSEQTARLIVWQSKSICSVISNVFIVAKTRIQALMKEKYIYTDGYTPMEVGSKVSTIDSVKYFFENDLEKQDKQTDHQLLDVEFALYAHWAGVHPVVLSAWRAVHNHWRMKSRLLSGMNDAMRLTGQATTSLGNMLVNLTVHHKFIKTNEDNIKLMLVLGDDNLCLMTQEPNVEHLKNQMAIEYNMKCKPSWSSYGGTFCQMLLYNSHIGNVQLSPCFTRLKNKWESPNGINECTPEIIEAKGLSYMATLGNLPDCRRISEARGYNVKFADYYYFYDAVRANATIKNLSEDEVMDNYNTLIDMIEHPKMYVKKILAFTETSY